MARKNADGGGSDAGVVKKVRVLADVVIEGVTYRANDVISIDAQLWAQYVDIAALDASPEAVQYCEAELGAAARDHAAEAAAVAAAQAPPAE